MKILTRAVKLLRNCSAGTADQQSEQFLSSLNCSHRFGQEPLMNRTDAIFAISSLTQTAQELLEQFLSSLKLYFYFATLELAQAHVLYPNAIRSKMHV